MNQNILSEKWYYLCLLSIEAPISIEAKMAVIFNMLYRKSAAAAVFAGVLFICGTCAAKGFEMVGKSGSAYTSHARQMERIFFSDLEQKVRKTAKSMGLDPDLAWAVAMAESGFNPRAVSRKGAMGLFQLMPALISQYGVSDPFDAIQNARAGIRHLKFLLKRYRGSVVKALAAYNAGEGAVRKYGGRPPYRETDGYIKRVLRLYYKLRFVYAKR